MNKGYFGDYGGLFIPETLSHALNELESLYTKIKNDEGFKKRVEISIKKSFSFILQKQENYQIPF